MSETKIARTVTLGYHDLVELERAKESAEHLVNVLRNTMARDKADLDAARAALEKIVRLVDVADANGVEGHPWILVGNMSGIARDALKAQKGMA